MNAHRRAASINHITDKSDLNMNANKFYLTHNELRKRFTRQPLRGYQQGASPRHDLFALHLHTTWKETPQTTYQ